MTAEARLQAGRAELARFVHATFRHEAEATAAMPRAFDRLTGELERRQ